MGYVDVTGVRHTLPDGRVLLDDVAFRVGEGTCAALVGENGAGKTTLLRIISGDLIPEAGSVARTTATPLAAAAKRDSSAVSIMLLTS